MSSPPPFTLGSVTFGPSGAFRPPKVEIKGRKGPKFTLQDAPERAELAKSGENAANLTIFGLLTSILDLLGGLEDGIGFLKAEIGALRRGLAREKEQ